MVDQQSRSSSLIIISEADDGRVIGDVDVHDDPSTLQTHAQVKHLKAFKASGWGTRDHTLTMSMLSSVPLSCRLNKKNLELDRDPTTRTHSFWEVFSGHRGRHCMTTVQDIH